MVVTRWNPSINGALHLGHIFTLLVNEHFAKTHDGKFHIRFDDTSPHILEMNPDHVSKIMDRQHEDIKWLGIKPDSFILQSELSESVHNKLENLGHYFIDEKKFNHYLPVFVRLGMTYVSYPYVPEQIAERVIMDNMIGATHLIRGEDFSTEYSLYCYFCQKFDLPTPEFIFLPRLCSYRGDISKTNGGYTIAELRNSGYSAKEVKRLLEKSCLHYPNNGWEIYNIKPNPHITI